MVATLSGASWVAAPAPASRRTATSQLVDVDCAAASSCVAVGDRYAPYPDLRPYVVRLTDAGWVHEPVPLPAGASTNPVEASLAAVDCHAAQSCAAVGYFGQSGSPGAGAGWTAGSTVRGGWRSRVVLAPTPGATQVDLNDVSCFAVGRCQATGSYWVGESSVSLALTVSISDASTPSVPVLGPLGSSAYVHTIDCAPTGRCAAGGFARDVSNGALTVVTDGTSVHGRHVIVPPGEHIQSSVDVVTGDSETTAAGIGDVTTGPLRRADADQRHTALTPAVSQSAAGS